MSASIDGASASFRASGLLRYVGAAFLLFWLAGWVLGEVFALGFLFMLIRSVAGASAGASWPIPGGEWIAGGAAGVVFLFLVVWLSLWTFGGYAAIRELLRNLAGEDRVTAGPASLQLVRRAGPFRRTRVFDRSAIRRVRLRERDKAVVIDTLSGTEEITNYGAATDRASLVEWLRHRLSVPEDDQRVDGLSSPPGWTMTIDGGAAHLSHMNRQARIAGALVSWFIAALTGLIWFGSLQNESRLSSAIAVTLFLLVTVWAAWVTWSRREWIVRQGQLTRHRRFAFWEWERTFKSARLLVTVSTDSDNDTHYTLSVTDEQGEKVISREIHDGSDTIHLGRWLSARTGFPLKLP